MYLEAINIGLDADTSIAICDMLNKLLADHQVLLAKSQLFHWNVRGSNFGPLHQLFEEIYQRAFTEIDFIAERIRQIGKPVIGGLSYYTQISRIVDTSVTIMMDADDMIADLLSDLQVMIIAVRVNGLVLQQLGNDIGTANYLGELILKLEKLAWKLRAQSPEIQLDIPNDPDDDDSQSGDEDSGEFELTNDQITRIESGEPMLIEPARNIEVDPKSAPTVDPILYPRDLDPKFVGRV